MTTTNSPQRESISWGRLGLYIFLPSALVASIRGLMALLVPLYSNFLDVSPALIGVAVSALPLGTAFTDMPASVILDRLGQRKTATLAFTLMLTAVVGLFAAKTFIEVSVWSFVVGAAIALWWLSRHFFITRSIPYSYRGRVSSLAGMTERIGMAVGPFEAGLISSNLGFGTAFASGLAFALPALVIYALGRKTIERSLPITVEPERDSTILTIRKNMNKMFPPAMIPVILSIVRQARYFIIPIYGVLVLGLPPFTIGLFMGVSGVVDILSAYPSGYIMDKFGRIPAIALSMGVMGGGLMAMAFSADALSFGVATVITGIGDGFGGGALLTVGADLGSQLNGKDMPVFLGMWRFTADIGSFFGPLAMGLLVKFSGAHMSTVFLATFSLMTIGLMPRLLRRRHLSPTTTASRA